MKQTSKIKKTAKIKHHLPCTWGSAGKPFIQLSKMFNNHSAQLLWSSLESFVLGSQLLDFGHQLNGVIHVLELDISLGFGIVGKLAVG